MIGAKGKSKVKSASATRSLREKRLSSSSLAPARLLPFDLPFRREPQYRPQNLNAGKYAGFQIPGNLTDPDPVLVGDGNLFDPQLVAHGFDLHLDRPAVIAVLHVELTQRIEPYGAERAKVGVAVSEQNADQKCRQYIAEPLVRLQRAFLSLAQRAGTEDEIRASTVNRRE